MNYEELALKKIGEAVSFAMKERKKSFYQLAAESGVSRTIIYKIVNGEGYEIKSLIRLLAVLQVHLEMSLLGPDNNVFTMAGKPPTLN